MAKPTSKQVAQARLRGDILSALRAEGFLPISSTCPMVTTVIQVRFGTKPSAFWKAVHELEQERCVRIASDGLYFVPPEERW